MPDFIPTPNLPTGLVAQNDEMLSRRNDPWAALASSLGKDVATGVKNYQDRQPFTPEQIDKLNKGEVPNNIPRSQAGPMYEARAILQAKQDQQNYLAANKEAHDKEMESLKSGHAQELQKMKDETAQAVARAKEEAAKAIADEKARNAKELADSKASAAKSLADFQAHHKESLAKLNSALKTGDAAAIKAAADDYNKSVSNSLVKTGLSKLGMLTPPKPATPSKMGNVKIPEGKIMVQDKEGKKHFLPKEQKDEAISQGYSVVSE